jgi:hypothetical protein
LETVAIAKTANQFADVANHSFRKSVERLSQSFPKQLRAIALLI